MLLSHYLKSLEKNIGIDFLSMVIFSEKITQNQFTFKYIWEWQCSSRVPDGCVILLTALTRVLGYMAAVFCKSSLSQRNINTGSADISENLCEGDGVLERDWNNKKHTFLN